MKTHEGNPEDWMFLARERLRAADLLESAGGSHLSGIELLQESVERFLKGWLVARGWQLQKVHDLSHLLEECIRREPRFEAFQDLADSLTEQFWAQHYPGADISGVGSNYEAMRSEVTDLVALISEPESTR
jgi:HEPN domain-containing protein